MEKYPLVDFFRIPDNESHVKKYIELVEQGFFN